MHLHLCYTLYILRRPYYQAFDTVVKVKGDEHVTLEDEMKKILPFHHMDWLKFRVRGYSLQIHS